MPLNFRNYRRLLHSISISAFTGFFLNNFGQDFVVIEVSLFLCLGESYFTFFLRALYYPRGL